MDNGLFINHVRMSSAVQLKIKHFKFSYWIIHFVNEDLGLLALFQRS